MTAYWTRAEREAIKRENTDALARGETHGVFTFPADETYRILATVDALEEALRSADATVHAEFDGSDPDPCDTCALLAALEGK